VIVLLALVTYCEDRDPSGIFDLEQRHVPRVAKRDNKLAQQRSVARPGLATGGQEKGEWSSSEKADSMASRAHAAVAESRSIMKCCRRFRSSTASSVRRTR